MFIEYAQQKVEIPVEKAGSTFKALNHAILLETQLRLKGVAEVVYQGAKIAVTRNDNGEIVELTK